MDDILKKLLENGDVSFGSFVDGKFIDSNDYSLAINSAEKAAQQWSNNGNRYDILTNISAGLRNKISSLLEMSRFCFQNPREFSISDVEHAISGYEYFSKLSKRNDLINQGFSGKGIVGAAILEECSIFSMLSWVTAAPLTAGNTIVLMVKPSYSVIALYFVSILHELGIPNGVINVLPFIESESFSSIASHLPRIIGILPANIKSSPDFHFSSVWLKKPSLCPVLVLKSADIDSAIDSFIDLTKNEEMIWFPNVIYVEEPIYDKFIKTMEFNVNKYNRGREKFYEKTETRKALTSFIDEKRAQGFKIIEIMHRLSNCFVIINDDCALSKSLIGDENQKMHHIVSLLPIRTEFEGLSRLNSNPGLAVSLWSNDAVDVIRTPSFLKYGTVWINCAALYCPSVSFSLWHSHGYGTFSGRRAFHECITKSNLKMAEMNVTDLYSADRNLMFPKKDLVIVVGQSLKAQSAWCKLDKGKRLSYLEDVVKSMQKNWNFHFKLVLNETSEAVWKKAIKSLDFWSCYAVENSHQQTVVTKGCYVICESKPLGVVAIVAGSTPLDLLMHLIAGALVFGNSVIVGLSGDKKSPIIGSELERIFQDKPDLVSVFVNSADSIWQQFIANSNVSTIWLVKNFCSYPSDSHSFKSIVGFEGVADMTQLADFFEIHATKAKAIWLPGA